jgi:hypothetical protein
MLILTTRYAVVVAPRLGVVSGLFRIGLNYYRAGINTPLLLIGKRVQS